MNTSKNDSREDQVLAQRYKLSKLLGKGGTGKVYLAFDQFLNNAAIALKVMNPEYSSDATLRARFLREVQLTRAVTHKNVVRTFDVAEDAGTMFFTMEYIEGLALKERVAKGTIPLTEGIGLLTQICEGLSAIHAQRIVHRDLKAANVIITADGGAKIADFGIARPRKSDLTAYLNSEINKCTS